jgi:hypothetical protein
MEISSAGGDPKLNADIHARHPMRRVLQATNFPFRERMSLLWRRDVSLNVSLDENPVKQRAKVHYIAKNRAVLSPRLQVQRPSRRAQGHHYFASIVSQIHRHPTTNAKDGCA